jgi:mannose-6-phosphate isomerase-like protein (cupin superfamily)
MLIVNLENAAVIETPHGSQLRPLIDRTTSTVSQCSLAEETLPPGSTVSRHHHEVIEEIYFIVSGTGSLRMGEEERAVRKGDAIFIPRMTPHELTNTGSEPMRIMLVCGPAYFREDHKVEE